MKSIVLSSCISANQDASTIQDYVQKFLLDYEKLHGQEYRPAQIVVDFSFALLLALCKTFHRVSLKRYLDQVFRGKIRFAKLSICKAHMMHTFARNAKAHYGIAKIAKQNFLILCCRMIEATTQTDLNAIFTKICRLLLSRNRTKSVQNILEECDKSKVFFYA